MADLKGLDRKAERLIHAALIVLAGGLTLTLFVEGGESVDPVVGVGLLAGGILNLGGLWRAASAYMEGHERGQLAIGPAPVCLVRAARTRDYDPDQYIADTVGRLPGFMSRNEALRIEVLSALGLAARLLYAGVAMYVVATFFVLAGALGGWGWP